MAEATIPTFMRGKEKIMSLSDAVKTFIKPGTCICPGGFSYTKKPFALAREVIRQDIKDLFVTMNGGASICEFWAAAGLVKLLDTTYIGLEGIQPVAYSVRRSIQDGTIDVEDYSNYGYGLRTVAGRYGWPFAPLMSEFGTSFMDHDTFGKMGLRGKKADGSWINPSIAPARAAVIEDPFDGWGLRPHAFEGGDGTSNKTNFLEQVRESTAYTGNKGVKCILVPPILPEVTIILAQRVGELGTTRIEGILGPDAEQAISAKNCIVQAEKVVTEEELRAQPYSNTIAMSPARCPTTTITTGISGGPTPRSTARTRRRSTRTSRIGSWRTSGHSCLRARVTAIRLLPGPQAWRGSSSCVPTRRMATSPVWPGLCRAAAESSSQLRR
jgi:glutaconate CoA-transferase subunit A